MGVSQLETHDGSQTNTDREAADELSKFFQSVFTHEPDGAIPTLPKRHDDTMHDIDFTVEDVRKKLDNLKADKCPGPDKLHPMVLKQCSAELSKPFCLIFRKSLDSGTLPKDWKTARVTPIFKKGSRTKPGNYKPLTCIPCKIMETLKKDKMTEFVKHHDLLSDKQNGSGKSCLTNLLETLEVITSDLDNGSGVDIIFLDYAKVFDSVQHRRLIKKLQAYMVLMEN